MRILLISSVYAPAFVYGGPPRVNLSLAMHLQSLGHSVQVLTTDANGDTALDVPVNEFTSHEGVPAIYLPRSHPHSYFFVPSLYSKLKSLLPFFDIALIR